MHQHPFFSSVNKSIILSMKKRIKVGAKKCCRKVDFLTVKDEQKILNHPNYQAGIFEGVQKQFGPVLYQHFLHQREY
jgi:hypothetical protein